VIRKIKLCCASILMVVMFSTSALAVIPVLFYGASIIFHLTVYAGYVWWTCRTGTGQVSADPTTANVVGPANVQWLDLSATPVIRQDNAKLKITKASILAKVHADYTKYPTLTDCYTVAGQWPQGSIVINGLHYITAVTSVHQDLHNGEPNAGGPAPAPTRSYVWVRTISAGYDEYIVSTTTYTEVQQPERTDRPAAEAAAKVNSEANNVAASSEVINIMNDDHSTVNITNNSSTGGSNDQPYSYPPAPTPAQIAANGGNPGGGGGNGGGDGGVDPFHNYSTPNNVPANPVPGTDYTTNGGMVRDMLNGKLTSVGTALKTHAPFSYWTNITTYLNVFNTGIATAPTFQYTIGGGLIAPQTMTISVAWLDPVASVSRFLLKTMFAIALVWSFKGYWHRE
jgi:hypothetical protein